MPGPALLVAGGSGLAPIQSILCTMLERGHSAPVTLYFGVRSERDLYHEALLRDLAARHPNFSYHVVLSEQKGAAGRHYGLVHQVIELPEAVDTRHGLPGGPAGHGGSRHDAARLPRPDAAPDSRRRLLQPMKLDEPRCHREWRCARHRPCDRAGLRRARRVRSHRRFRRIHLRRACAARSGKSSGQETFSCRCSVRRHR